MKLLSFLLPVFFMLSASSQSSLTSLNTGKPKLGQKTAFEAAYKKHNAAFHKGDNKINVYEIVSGEYAGYYHFATNHTYADLDKQRPDAAAHDADMDKNLFPLMMEMRFSMNATYRYMDSLSFHTDIQAEKFVVNVRYIKSDLNMSDWRREMARSAKILAKLNGNFWQNLSFTYWEKLWDGSENIVVSVRALKDGFASLEPGFYGQDPAGSPTFRDEYVKAYGYDAWEERVKLLDNAEEKRVQYRMKLRKDLSSQ